MLCFPGMLIREYMNGYEIFPVVHIFTGLVILDYYYYYYINTTFINFSIGIYRKFIKDFFFLMLQHSMT
jgi:hypothetical protein